MDAHNAHRHHTPHDTTTDGLDEVRPGEMAGSIRGQVIGLLNAIQYLKRTLII